MTIVATLSTALLLAQVPSPTQPNAGIASPAFDVASIKENKSVEGGGGLRIAPGGRVTATNVPLRTLVVFAYGLKSFQIIGGPGWIRSDRFNVIAQAEGNPSADQLRLMMRTLLADRFKFRAHQETREVAGYALIRTREDRFGPNLKKAAVDCSLLPRGSRSSAPPPPNLKQLIDKSSCGITERPGSLIAGGITMATLADIFVLNGLVGGVVVDRTGLSGAFDVQLRWSPEFDLPASGAATPTFDAPSIFTAVQEQLGLKLEAQRIPATVLVIDHAERPTEN